MPVGFTKAQYRESVARVFDLYTGTATGGTTGTLVDSALARYGNDFFNGANVYIKTSTDGLAPQAESVYVTDFVAATGTVSVTPSFTVAPAAGDTYQIYTRITKAEIDDALDICVTGAEVATSLAGKSDSLDYYVTDAPKLLRRQNIIGVYRRSNDDVQNPPIEIVGWTFEDAEGILVLRLPYTLSTSDIVWLVYYAGEYSITDTSYVNLPISLVRARAVKYLCETKIGNVSDKEWWGSQLRYWSEEVKKEETMFQRRSKKVRMANWQAMAGGSSAFIENQSWLEHLAVDTGAHLIIGA